MKIFINCPLLRLPLTTAILTAALLLCACVARQHPVEALMPTLDTMTKARLYLGYPSTSRPGEDSAIIHEWLLDASYQEQGKWVREKAPWVRRDRDGYRVDVYRDVWYPPHKVNKYCRIRIIADEFEQVISSSWEGHSCEDLIR
ncbi:hypothetical protein LJC09_05220 [Desulfovibrio sp. OttesenSCG-928-F20]|nr:hypothetical protein [Desulfovibrio sp. OttesenSCG-928-F20]